MSTLLPFRIQAQPDDTTCGPTCLRAVYRYYDDAVGLKEVIRETRRLKGGGTLGVFLANHALRRGYRAILYTFNLHVFDPTWFKKGGPDLRKRLQARMAARTDHKLRVACRGYLEFLELGGTLRFDDLRPRLIYGFLNQGLPILTGLSATFLHRAIREIPATNEEDDLLGDPTGHFVVLCGHQRNQRLIHVCDPLRPNPIADRANYAISVDRVINAILLGIVTYDANLLVIHPAGQELK